MSSDLEAARKIYFAHDGFQFHMWQNGVDLQYRLFRVPPDVELGWLRELTERYVAALDQPGNWKSVSFLEGHGDLTHLEQVAASTPQGVFWEKCAFLEHVLNYADKCSVEVPQPRIHEVYQGVLHHARSLARGVRAPESVQRVERLMARAAGSHRAPR